MCTTEQTFAWVGAIVVNVAFLSFIAWGASANWLVGFALSVVYTGLLFGLARFVDTKSGWERTGDEGGGAAAADDGSLHDEADVGVASGMVANDPERRMPPLANLFYGLFALALGVSGYFLPMNLFPCSGGGPPYKPAGHWATNFTDLPENVQSWATSTEPRVSVSNFVFIAGEKITLFTGSDESGTNLNSLWAAPASVYPFNGGEPVHFPNVTHPSQFIVTGTGRACFFAYRNDPPPSPSKRYPPQPKPIYGTNVIGCCDGKTLTTTNPSINELHGPYDFFIDNSTKVLWFKDYPPTVGSQAGDGKLIYSISDYETMEVVLHSTYRKGSRLGSYEATTTTGNGYSKPYVPPEEMDSTVDGAENGMECMAKQSILALFVSAIPISVVSVLLWIMRRAPSMAVTSYIGISATASFTFIAVRGNSYDMDNFYRWWLSITGAVFVLVLVDLLSCKRKITHSPLVWGINFGSLVYFIGMIMLTGIFDLGNAWQWIIFNAFALVPLGIIGLATNQVFLLVLCAVGWLLDSVKFASWISDAMPSDEAPIQFVVLAISGLLIAGAGWLLSKHQEEVHNVLCYQFERISISRKIFPEASGHVAVQTEEDGLLPSGLNSQVQRSGSGC
mmetsp:Transcript_27955/g.80781  ORF Transcript_27955/g.80781 Transcript_27955/m.80781 type:complete len:619 (+) Transcript_27955:195-2051(+)